MPSLFDPLDLTPTLTLPNRIIMAPLTRGRADRDGVHDSKLAATYYAQRSSAGLIITEATGISREGLGWPYAPGLWSAAQVEAWKPVVEAVHQAGGRIVAQLWHMGRMVHSSVTGAKPLSASVLPQPGRAHSYDGKKLAENPRAATKDDIARTLDDYERAARHAMAAGFDGVQVHGANGYLIDQFLRKSTNIRIDEYGGEITNRVRLLREVADRVVAAVGSAKVGFRLSPNGEVNGCVDPDHLPLFTEAARQLQDAGVSWLELREPGPHSTFAKTDQAPASGEMRKAFHGPIILNSDYRLESAKSAVESGAADAIAFGRPFISNPDLPARLKAGAELNRWNVETFYSQGPEGYVDYPAMDGNV